jgi:hypothetical protein
MDENKRICLDICSLRLAHYCEDGDNFLQHIVTSDDNWVRYYQPETKQAEEHAMQASTIM